VVSAKDTDLRLRSSEGKSGGIAYCNIAPFYGYLIWINHAQHVFPSVPASSYFAIGAGSSFTWIEPERRMVLVVRWIDADHADPFFGCVLRALDESG